MKRSTKNLISILIGTVMVAALVAALLRVQLRERTEVALGQAFLASQTNLWRSVGELESIEYQADSAARVSFHGGHMEGFYTYNVAGNLDDYDVRLYWRNSRAGDDFTVLRVERLRGGDAPTILWKDRPTPTGWRNKAGGSTPEIPTNHRTNPEGVAPSHRTTSP
jgi:hypothetical protein